jgi:hypothetical protein
MRCESRSGGAKAIQNNENDTWAAILWLIRTTKIEVSTSESVMLNTASVRTIGINISLND